jgi:hypothetical protein
MRSATSSCSLSVVWAIQPTMQSQSTSFIGTCKCRKSAPAPHHNRWSNSHEVLALNERRCLGFVGDFIKGISIDLVVFGGQLCALAHGFLPSSPLRHAGHNSRGHCCVFAHPNDGTLSDANVLARGTVRTVFSHEMQVGDGWTFCNWNELAFDSLSLWKYPQSKGIPPTWITKTRAPSRTKAAKAILRSPVNSSRVVSVRISSVRTSRSPVSKAAGSRAVRAVNRTQIANPTHARMPTGPRLQAGDFVCEARQNAPLLSGASADNGERSEGYAAAKQPRSSDLCHRSNCTAIKQRRWPKGNDQVSFPSAWWRGRAALRCNGKTARPLARSGFILLSVSERSEEQRQKTNLVVA